MRSRANKILLTEEILGGNSQGVNSNSARSLFSSSHALSYNQSKFNSTEKKGCVGRVNQFGPRQLRLPFPMLSHPSVDLLKESKGKAKTGQYHSKLVAFSRGFGYRIGDAFGSYGVDRPTPKRPSSPIPLKQAFTSFSTNHSLM